MEVSLPFPAPGRTGKKEALTQSEQVAEWLRTDIISCRLMPAAKLNIATLADERGVSLGAVREALAGLASEGLVVAEPQRGYRVSPVSSRSLSELVQARIHIEGLCLTEAVRHGDLRWETACLRALERLKQAGAGLSGADAVEEQVRAHREFHHALVSGCNNEWLLRMQHFLYQQSERYRRLSVPLGGPPRDIDAEHAALVEAALARDADRARQLLEQHLSTTARNILTSPHLNLGLRP